jgi:hypothetical protein
MLRHPHGQGFGRLLRLHQHSGWGRGAATTAARVGDGGHGRRRVLLPEGADGRRRGLRRDRDHGQRRSHGHGRHWDRGYGRGAAMDGRGAPRLLDARLETGGIEFVQDSRGLLEKKCMGMFF